MKKRLTAIILIAIIAAGIVWIAKSELQITEKKTKEPVIQTGKETLYLWYTDDALTTFLSSAAVTYNESHDVRVVPVLESGLEYLESINKASVDSSAPDLYIITNDSLEKAYLAGLASEIKPDFSLEDTFMETGIRAATYKDKVIAYPYYFDTSSLLYNRTYLLDMAENQLQAEAEDMEAEFSEEQIEEKANELLPRTIEGIRSFADSYDAPEQVEAVFEWDLTDLFYNYFFVGSAINMGGAGGYDNTQIDIYNKNAISSMKAYQNLNNFFSMDTGASSYDDIIQRFIDGKTVFTLATTDVVARLEQAKSDGTFAYDYALLTTPAINTELPTSSLSVTNCIVVNGYTKNKDAANDFAEYLCKDNTDTLYSRTGKVSACKDVTYEYDSLRVFAEEYLTSVPIPKMIETSNYWVQLEAVFSEIWNGADANTMLKTLSEQMKQQVTGEKVEEEKIEDETATEETVEYLDEEYYRQEAQKDQ